MRREPENGGFTTVVPRENTMKAYEHSWGGGMKWKWVKRKWGRGGGVSGSLRLWFGNVT